MVQKMRILVTGGLGHIGSQLIRDLAILNDIELIRILDNLSTQRYCSLFNLPSGVKWEFLQGDVRSREDLEQATKDIDIVFHLAATTKVQST